MTPEQRTAQRRESFLEAGLNLFGNPVVGLFMRNLGAYTVDRLKRDPLYKLVLKEYATYSLELGYPGLFFPGGTRARSGMVEKHLKMGLLGTTLAAFRNNLVARRPQPRLFIFPVTVSYPLVLEASTLIEDCLRREGQARYIIDELNRGAIGALPAVELTDLHVAIYEAHVAGDAERTRELYRWSLPLLVAQMIYRMRLTKYVLKQRGIADRLHVRAPLPELDEFARQDVDTMLADLDRWWKPPSD